MSNGTKIVSEMTMEDLRFSLMSYLQDEGFKPNVDDDGDIAFKYQGYSIYISVDENDLPYIRMILASEIDFEESSREAALMYANEINSTWKIAKVHLLKKAVIIEVSQFVYRIDSYLSLFDRQLKILTSASSEFFKKIAEE